MRRPAVLLLACLTLGIAPGVANGAVGYVSGTEVNTPASGSCFSTFFRSAFTRQDNTNPRVGELFYVSLTATFIDSFDCAADFVSAAMTLPSGVEPFITADTPMICRRYGTNGSGQTVFDTRAKSNCPTGLALSGGTYSLRPVSNPIAPDVGGPAGSYWTLGYPLREAQNYPSVQLLVPVKATATMNGATISHFSCAVSTGCLTSSVGGLTIGAAADGAGGGGGNGGAVGGTGASTATVSLAGDLVTGAVGAAIPISVESTQPFKIMTDISTTNTTSSDVYTGNRPCGFSSAAMWPGTGFYADDGGFTWMLGAGFDASPSPCFLTPNTLYYYRVCVLNQAGTNVVNNSCRDSSFRTGAVQASFDAPQDTPAGRPNSVQMTLTGKVVGAHPSGTLQLQARLAGFGSYENVVKVGGGSTAQAYGQGASDVLLTPQTITGVSGGSTFPFFEWNAYELRACASGTCSAPRKLIAGGMYDDQSSSNVTQTGATLSALPSSPRPAGSLTFHLGTTEPPSGQGDDLPVSATVALAASAATAPETPFTTALAGLSPGTTYFWSACFDRTGGFGVTGAEDCSTIRSFTTVAAPATDTNNTGGTGTTTTTPATQTPTGDGTQTPAASTSVLAKPFGGKILGALTAAAIAKAAGGGMTQTASAGGATGFVATAPKKLRRNRAKGKLVLGFLLRGAGKLDVQLKKGTKRKARGGFTASRPGAAGFALTLPKGLGTGKHTLVFAFTPPGASKAKRVSIPVAVA